MAEPLSFSCDDIGDIDIDVEVEDVNGNSSDASIEVTIIDNIAPVVFVEDENIELVSDEDGFAELEAEDLDDGSKIILVAIWPLFFTI